MYVQKNMVQSLELFLFLFTLWSNKIFYNEAVFLISYRLCACVVPSKASPTRGAQSM